MDHATESWCRIVNNNNNQETQWIELVVGQKKVAKWKRLPFENKTIGRVAIGRSATKHHPRSLLLMADLSVATVAALLVAAVDAIPHTRPHCQHSDTTASSKSITDSFEECQTMAAAVAEQ